MGVGSDRSAPTTSPIPADPSWRRVLALLWGVNFLTAVGMMAFLPFFPIYLRELGLTDPRAITIWSGVLVGGAPFCAAIMGGVWGAIGDQLGRRAMILRALIGITVFVSLMAFARSPWVLLLLRFGQGTFSGFVAPTMTLVSVLAPADQQGRVSGTLQTSILAGSVVGPLLGGALASRVGFFGTAMTCAGLSLLAAVVVRVFVPEPPLARSAPRHGEARGLLRASRAVLGRARDELREALRHPVLRPLLMVLFLVRVAVAALNPTLLIHVERISGEVGEAAARLGSMVFAANPVAVLLALPFWSRAADRRDPWKLLAICVGAGAAMTLIQVLASTPFELGTLRFVAGAFLAGVFPAGFALVARATDASRRGGTTGLAFSALAFGLALGPWMCAVIDGLYGYRVLLVVCGSLLLVANLRLLWVRRLGGIRPPTRVSPTRP